MDARLETAAGQAERLGEALRELGRTIVRAFRGSTVVFDVYVCPVCRRQLHPEGDEYSVDCYDHPPLVRGVPVEVTVDEAEITRQLASEPR